MYVYITYSRMEVSQTLDILDNRADAILDILLNKEES